MPFSWPLPCTTLNTYGTREFFSVHEIRFFSFVSPSTHFFHRQICSFLFLFPSQSTSDLSPQFILYDTLCIVSSLAWPFLFCYFATFATGRISSIGNVVYSSNWYNFPPNTRKYVTLVIARSQQPLYFSGLGLIRCTLELFGNVML